MNNSCKLIRDALQIASGLQEVTKTGVSLICHMRLCGGRVDFSSDLIEQRIDVLFSGLPGRLDDMQPMRISGLDSRPIRLRHQEKTLLMEGPGVDLDSLAPLPCMFKSERPEHPRRHDQQGLHRHVLAGAHALPQSKSAGHSLPVGHPSVWSELLGRVPHLPIHIHRPLVGQNDRVTGNSIAPIVVVLRHRVRRGQDEWAPPKHLFHKCFDVREMAQIIQSRESIAANHPIQLVLGSLDRFGVQDTGHDEEPEGGGDDPHASLVDAPDHVDHFMICHSTGVLERADVLDPVPRPGVFGDGHLPLEKADGLRMNLLTESLPGRQASRNILEDRERIHHPVAVRCGGDESPGDILQFRQLWVGGTV